MLDAVREGRIDVGPLDSYWHMLIARHQPELTSGIRVLASTEPATLPAFVTSATTPGPAVAALREAFATASQQRWFASFAEPLMIEGFAPVDLADYARTLDWDSAAKAAGYPYPA